MLLHYEGNSTLLPALGETIPMSNKYDFATAKRKGKVVSKESYHQPNRGFGRGCSCRKTTEKGAYRDVAVELPNGDVAHFYHQHNVATKLSDGRVRVDNCGYNTSTTKERINRYVPSRYRVFQEDFEWYVSTPEEETIPFENGIVLG